MGGAETANKGEESHEPGESQEAPLRDLFVSITGVEELVETQERSRVDRYLDTETESVSDTVTSVAKEDGLRDTIDEPAADQLD